MVTVIDASVAIKWFVREEGFERAMEILKELLSTPKKFAVPELFYFELVNVFNRLIPAPSKTQEELLAAIINIGINRFSMTSELAAETKNIQRLGLSGYDGAYLALAKLLKGRWVTFDQEAHNAISHLGLSECLF